MSKMKKDPEMSPTVPAGKPTGGAFWETVRTIIYAVLLAGAVRTFGYEPFNIPSGSMIPTLLVGDYLFVSKFSYGFSRYSLPFSPPLIDDRIMADEPERGDVIVFKLPLDNKTDYIKRLIGLPGDKIQVKQGLLHVNGAPVRRREVLAGDFPGADRVPPGVRQFVETLPNGREHLIWEYGDYERYDDTPIYSVPEGHYFFMGDNRDRSLDSRVTAQVGFVPFANLIGRADFLFFSHNGGAPLWNVFAWPGAIRFSRIGNGID
jgi:signal peptidase I